MHASIHNAPAHEQLEYFVRMAEATPPMPTAVVHPVDPNSLDGAIEAAKHNLIEPVLVGPAHKIEACAKQLGLDLSPYRLIDVEHSHAAAAMSCQLVRKGEVQALMKGGISSDEFLSAVMDKEAGIRTARRLSHVFVLDVPLYHKPLFITDAAINIAPDLSAKRDILQNTIDFCQRLGIQTPKVGILAAIEKVNARMPSTLDAAALCKMADRGQIQGAILDGPLAFDNAISAEAARDKHIESPVAGDVDILLAPDLEAANMLGKQLIYLSGAKSAGLVLGARVPLILTSRAEKTLGRLASCALAALFMHPKQDEE